MGIMENLLPRWVVTIIKDYVINKLSGSVTITFSDGGVRNVKKQNLVNPPKNK